VYTAGASAITGYSVNADGSLTAVTGSPYAVATDNNIVTNGSNVYTVDVGGQTLKIYSIDKSSGALTFGSSANAISSQTFSGDIVSNLSLDHTGATLYAGNVDSSGDDGQNAFNVSSGTTATELAYQGSSEVFGPPLVFSPDNNFAYSGNCYHIGWDIFRYTRNSDGTLNPPTFQPGADGPPVLPPSGDFPCPAAFAVSANGFLAVGYTPTPQGGTYMIGTYTINSDGSLTPVSGSLATTASNGGNTGNTPVSISFDPTGTYLAVAGNGGIQTYSMNSGGLLTAVASPQDAGTSFLNVAWDKSNHLFATTSSQLYVWNASSGQLTPAAGSPYPGATGLAVLPLQ
jgi:6-phosphogluconolactonase (cycloisomerase 2 family)